MTFNWNDDNIIYDLAFECESLFKQLQEVFLNRDTEPAVIHLCGDFQQRFAIWTAHLGVFARRSQCLDRRLEKFPDLLDLVTRLLDILRRTLFQWRTEQGGQGVQGSVSKTSLGVIDDTLSRLSHLGVTIRRSSFGRIDTKARDFAAGLDMTRFVALCIEAIQILYPNAHSSLKDHLSRSMRDRYIRILYSRSRHQKLSSRRELPSRLLSIPETRSNQPQTKLPIHNPAMASEATTATDPIVPATIAPSTADLTSVNISLIRSRNKLPDEASTRLHKTSTVQVNQSSYPRIPTRNGTTSSISCEWCSELLDLGRISASQWRQHVDKDLRPYICLSEQCSEGHPLYSTFDEWFRHMGMHKPQWHRRMHTATQWECAVCEFNQEGYSDPEALQSHLQEIHGDDFTEDQIQAISESSKTEKSRAWNDCLLCYFSVEKEGEAKNSTGWPKRPTELSEMENKTINDVCGMGDCDSHISDTESSDVSMDSVDHIGSTQRREEVIQSSKHVARHIAAHLQMLMTLTLRFVALQAQDDGFDDDIGSVSVEMNETSSDLEVGASEDLHYIDSKAGGTLRPVEHMGNTGEPRNDHTTQDIAVPDSDYDLSVVPRRYDNLAAEDDGFLKQIVASGAYQSWKQQRDTLQPKHSEYTVLWICTTLIEHDAARSLFDEQYNYNSSDSFGSIIENDYSLGRIDDHHVVMVMLHPGQYDDISGAIVAQEILQNFPNIRFGLIVGTSLGVSTLDHDIWLGDVVVGEYHTRVVQGQVLVEPVPSKQRPPQLLLDGISSLKEEFEREGHPISAYVDQAMEQYPGLKQQYSRPSMNSARLHRFACSYPASRTRCRHQCSLDSFCIMHRMNPEGDEHSSTIHYGRIVIETQQMGEYFIPKDTETLEFELGAAALMSYFPSLVLRGISHYSNSPFGTEWEGFAAMSAAAYAKALLHKFSALSGASMPVLEVPNTSTASVNKVDNSLKEYQLQKIRRWLSPPDHQAKADFTRERRYPGTGTWFLNSQDFQGWELGSRHYLWIYGPAGCGKTFLSTRVLDHLLRNGAYTTLSFFFDSMDARSRKLEHLLRSLAVQLYIIGHEASRRLDSLFMSCRNGQTQPTMVSLINCINAMMQFWDGINIVLDAVDECSTREELRDWMEHSLNDKTKLFVTSRHREAFIPGASAFFDESDCIQLDPNAINADIRSFVKAKLQGSPIFAGKHLSKTAQTKICKTIGDKAHDMFLWTACQLESLSECSGQDEMLKSLRFLASDLHGTYRQMIAKILPDLYRGTIRLFQFLFYTKRPLTLAEAADILALESFNSDQRRLIEIHIYLRRSLSSFLKILKVTDENDTVEEVHLAHDTFRIYLSQTPLFDLETASIGITGTCLAFLDKVARLDDSAVYKPFTEYAARFWPDYAASSEDFFLIFQTIIDFMEDEPTFKKWTKLYQWHVNFAVPKTSQASRLYFACFCGLKRVAKYFIDQEFDMGQLAGRYGDALQAASFGGHQDIVRLLIEYKADINAQGDPYGNALQAASYKGNEAVVKILIDHGAEVNILGGPYVSALSAAMHKGHQNIEKLLVERGAKVNADAIRDLHVTTDKHESSHPLPERSPDTNKLEDSQTVHCRHSE